MTCSSMSPSSELPTSRQMESALHRCQLRTLLSEAVNINVVVIITRINTFSPAQFYLSL